VQAATKLNVWLYRRADRAGSAQRSAAHRAGCLLPPRRQISWLWARKGRLQEDPTVVRNLAAAGAGQVRVGDQNHDVEARVASAAEREQLWAVITARSE
jgi:hypothetical protein